MTGTTADGIEIERDIAAPAAQVFAAWTTPESFARWFGGAQVEVPGETLDFVAEPGRAWTARMVLPDGNGIDWAGEFVEVAANERFVFTITDRPAEPEQAAIVVRLAETPEGTRMSFAQEAPGFTDEQKAGLLAGWQGFLDELERVATAA